LRAASRIIALPFRSLLTVSLPDPQTLEICAARALEAARRAGASQAETNVSTNRALTVNVRMGEVE
jgi:hypothetical protein